MGPDVLILLLPLVLLLFIMSRGRRQQRALATLQASLAPGQRVITTAGLHATVVEVGDTTVVLEPAPGVRTTWARQAVVRTVADAAHDVVPTDASSLTEPAPGSVAGDVDPEGPSRPQR